MTVVDLSMKPDWEGLDYHRFFYDRCSGRITLQRLDTTHDILEFPGSTLLEYHDGTDLTESDIAWKMLNVWRYHRNNAHVKIRYHFERSSEAAMFKITFS